VNLFFCAIDAGAGERKGAGFFIIFLCTDAGAGSGRVLVFLHVLEFTLRGPYGGASWQVLFFLFSCFICLFVYLFIYLLTYLLSEARTEGQAGGVRGLLGPRPTYTNTHTHTHTHTHTYLDVCTRVHAVACSGACLSEQNSKLNPKHRGLYLLVTLVLAGFNSLNIYWCYKLTSRSLLVVRRWVSIYLYISFLSNGAISSHHPPSPPLLPILFFIPPAHLYPNPPKHPHHHHPFHLCDGALTRTVTKEKGVHAEKER
jgi:hypothetical protein